MLCIIIMVQSLRVQEMYALYNMVLYIAVYGKYKP